MGTYAERRESGLAKTLDALAQFLFDQKKIKVKPDVANYIDTRPLEKYLATRKRQ